MRKGIVIAIAVAALAMGAVGSVSPANASWWPFDDGGHRHHNAQGYPPPPNYPRPHGPWYGPGRFYPPPPAVHGHGYGSPSWGQRQAWGGYAPMRGRGPAMYPWPGLGRSIPGPGWQWAPPHR